MGVKMKKLILITAILFTITIKAQNSENSIPPGRYEFGALGGFNTSAMQSPNYSLLFEGRYKITENLAAKLSIGFSGTSRDEGYNIKTFKYFNYDDLKEYRALSYNLEKREYRIIPVTIGLEYRMNFEKVSPYCSFDFGANTYRITPVTGPYHTVGTYNTFIEIPEDYQREVFPTYGGISYRIGLGMGIRYSIARSLNLDLRYLYQVNTSLVNCHSLLLGINLANL
jgi:hypothetical protein